MDDGEGRQTAWISFDSNFLAGGEHFPRFLSHSLGACRVRNHHGLIAAEAVGNDAPMAKEGKDPEGDYRAGAKRGRRDCRRGTRHDSSHSSIGFTHYTHI